MLGAIAGDVIGSVYEGFPIKQTDFSLFDRRATFTDDTVLTVAIAYAIMNPEVGYAAALKAFGRKYPRAGYGGNFSRWLLADESEPYNSWGNGSAMRVSPVGWAFNSREQVLAEAERTASVSHNHPEGIKGAQAISLGGDSDTLACMAGSVAHAYYGGVPQPIATELRHRLPPDLLAVVDTFQQQYNVPV